MRKVDGRAGGKEATTRCVSREIVGEPASRLYALGIALIRTARDARHIGDERVGAPRVAIGVPGPGEVARARGVGGRERRGS